MSADVRGGLSTESCGHGRGRNSADADADAKISASAQSLTVTSLPQHILKVMTAWSLVTVSKWSFYYQILYFFFFSGKHEIQYI